MTREPCIYLVYADPRDEDSDLVDGAGYVRLFSGHPEFGSHFKVLVEDAVTGELSSEDIDIVTMLGQEGRTGLRWTDAVKAAQARQQREKASADAIARDSREQRRQVAAAMASAEAMKQIVDEAKTEGDDHGE